MKRRSFLKILAGTAAALWTGLGAGRAQIEATPILHYNGTVENLPLINYEAFMENLMENLNQVTRAVWLARERNEWLNLAGIGKTPNINS